MQAFDFETCKIAPGLLAPPPVCLATVREGERPELAGSDNALRYMERALSRLLQSGGPIVGFNVPFDVGVWLTWFPAHVQAIFDALDEGRFLDAMIAERLREMAWGEPARYRSLSALCEAYGLPSLDKADSPQKDYARLFGVPVREYPEAHRVYPLKDADAHLRVFQRVWQRSKSRVRQEAIASETKHAVWLHLCAARGFRTDASRIDELRANAMRAVQELRASVVESGFLRGPDAPKPYSKDMAAIRRRVLHAYGKAAPLSKTGKAWIQKGNAPLFRHVATDKITLQDSGDPLLEEFAHYGEWSAVLNKDVSMLSRGVLGPVHTRFRMADGGRTTSSDPNTQNFRRMPGIRECVIPRPGQCFGQIDVSGLELGTQAQIHVWHLNDSRMADLINHNVDLHLLSACRLMRWEYSDAEKRLKSGDRKVKEIRQFCKIANFGYPGWMAARTLVPYARNQGVRITLEQAEDLRENWGRVLPGCLRYLRWTKTFRNRATNLYDFEVPGTEGIRRSGATLAASANGRFQGLGARCMKNAGWAIMKEHWTDRSSPLREAHMLFFIHDEFISEIPIGLQDPVMRRQDAIIRRELRRTMPDVAMKTEFCAMAYWSKNAQEQYNARKELQIWEA